MLRLSYLDPRNFPQEEKEVRIRAGQVGSISARSGRLNFFSAFESGKSGRLLVADAEVRMVPVRASAFLALSFSLPVAPAGS